MASIVAMAMAVPMAIGGDTATTGATVGNPAATITSLNEPSTNVALQPGSTSATTDIIVNVTLEDANGDDTLANYYTAKINTAATGAGTQVGNDINVSLVAGTKDGDQTAMYNGTGGAILYNTSADTYYIRIYQSATEILPKGGVSMAITVDTQRSLHLNTTSITFGTVAPDTQNNTQTSADIVAWNDGNVDNTPTPAFDSTADLTKTGEPSEIIPGTGLDFGVDPFGTVNPTDSDTANFTLDVPVGTKTGAYGGDLTITAAA